jgi:diguanylate cyclase (GGDEF)-like protein
MIYPKLFRVAQRFEEGSIEDIEATVMQEITRINPAISIGQSVAVAVGSRGIDRHHLIVKAVVEYLLDVGAKPYIVPAMGSHGGATAEGQAAILAGFGIDELNMGVPIRASMEVIELGTTEFGMPVYFDRLASEADHLVLVNRIKPHTRFAGKIESGLIKMMAIGLGKQVGASTYHRAFPNFSFDRVVRSIYQIVSAKIPLSFGIAVLENGYQKTAQITAIPGDQIEQVEEELLIQAKVWFPGLPFKDVDLLIIDQIGKDISGAGMDTNVTGLKRLFSDRIEGELPHVKRIYLRDLTAASRGNAMGFGLADFVSTKLVGKVDFASTYMNAVTGQNLRGAATPVHFDTDAEVMNAAFAMIGAIEPENAKVIWIKNTRDLTEVEVSAAYLESAVYRTDLSILTGLRTFSLDKHGNLAEFDSFGKEDAVDSSAMDEKMRIELHRWALLDGLTHILNRHSFELLLEQKWGEISGEQTPLSLILTHVYSVSEIDKGFQNDCLIEISRLINHIAGRSIHSLIARYDPSKFAVVLPYTSAEKALLSAVAIQKALACLSVFRDRSHSFSIGIATTLPEIEVSPQRLIDTVNQALDQADKEHGSIFSKFVG